MVSNAYRSHYAYYYSHEKFLNIVRRWRFNRNRFSLLYFVEKDSRITFPRHDFRDFDKMVLVQNRFRCSSFYLKIILKFSNLVKFFFFLTLYDLRYIPTRPIFILRRWFRTVCFRNKRRCRYFLTNE